MPVLGDTAGVNDPICFVQDGHLTACNTYNKNGPGLGSLALYEGLSSTLNYAVRCVQTSEVSLYLVRMADSVDPD